MQHSLRTAHSSFPKFFRAPTVLRSCPRLIVKIQRTVNVVRDIDGLEIVIPRQFEVSGRTVVDLDGPMLPRFRIQATSLTGNSVNALAGNGTFRMILPEGTYRFMTSGFPAGYSVRSMKSGAVDLLTEPLIAVGAAPIPEIVVTSRCIHPNALEEGQRPCRCTSGIVVARRNPSRPGWRIRQFCGERKPGWLVRVPQGSAGRVQVANQSSPADSVNDSDCRR